MHQVTIADVKTRLRVLTSPQSSQDRMLVESAQSIIETRNVNNVRIFIEKCSKKNQIPMYVCCEMLDSIIPIATKSEIHSIGDYMVENYISKVRSASEYTPVFKSRITRWQNKLKSPIDRDDFSINIPSSVAISSTPAPKQDDIPEENIQEAIASYTKMLDKCRMYAECDRVLNNYNNISKRFNLDKVFIENSHRSVSDIVLDLCEKIDTYSIGNDIKFCTVIETAWYGFETYSIPYTKSDILETAVDYFMFKPDGIKACKSVLETTIFFDKKKDMKNVDILMEEEPEDDQPADIDQIIMQTASTHKFAVTESTDFNTIFNNFKKTELRLDDDKPQNKIKYLLSILYRKDVNSIVDGTPDILKWFRMFFIVGTCAVPVIGPILAGVEFIADKFIEIYNDRNELPKMIKCFNNEIKVSKARLADEEDKEKREKLEKYIKSLEDAKSKLMSYYDKLLSDKEREENNIYDDEDFNIDDFLENNIITKLSHTIESLIEVSDAITPKAIRELMGKLNENDLSIVSKVIATNPDAFYREDAITGLIKTINDTRSGKIQYESTMDRSLKLSALSNALYILENTNKNPKYTLGNIDEAIEDFNILAEAYSAIAIMIDTYSDQGTMLEASFTNKLNVAMMKLRNSFTKMSDAERRVSRNLDMGMSGFKKGIERALTTDNREAVIKGSILPSFSKIVKLCLVNAGLIALQQPVLAVIVAIGYFACSAKFKAKERQMVIDEIEIELEMCEKYIQIAESKNDMKALRQLLTTKKELQRQLQRIKYKMSVDFGQKYYSASAPKD